MVGSDLVDTLVVWTVHIVRVALSFLPVTWLSLPYITIEREKSVTIVAIPFTHAIKSPDHHALLPFRRSPYQSLAWMPMSHPAIFADTLRLHTWFLHLLFQTPLIFLTIPGLFFAVVWIGVITTFHLFYKWMVRLRCYISTLDWILFINLLYSNDLWIQLISHHTVAVAVKRHVRLGVHVLTWGMRPVYILRRRLQRIPSTLWNTFLSGSHHLRTAYRQGTRYCRFIAIHMTVRIKTNPAFMLKVLIGLSYCCGLYSNSSFSQQKATMIDFTTIFKTKSTAMSAFTPKIPDHVRQVLQAFEGCQVIGSRFPTAFLGETKNGSEPTTTCRNEMRQAAARQGLQALNTGPTDLIRIICDSGASLTCIGNKDEFVTLTERTTPTELKGIASG